MGDGGAYCIARVGKKRKRITSSAALAQWKAHPACIMGVSDSIGWHYLVRHMMVEGSTLFLPVLHFISRKAG